MSGDQVSIGSLLQQIFGFSGPSATGGFDTIAHLASSAWLWISVVGYLLSIVALVIIIYATIRLYEVRKREDEYYGTLVLAPERAGSSPRWTHIQTLIGSTSPSEWREAIIEADIMLDDMLTRQGYSGEGVGEKLRQVERSDFATLGDAQEAHGVRNRVAHQGSAYDLSQTLAQRTIARYEAVFREFGAI